MKASAKEGLMQQSVEDTAYRLERTTQEERTGDPSLWERILGLVEQDLEERRTRKLFVEVREESGSYRKEIGELSATERRSLHPALRERVAERLLDRYLAGQGHVDLADKRRPYTKKIEDLAPEDLPALVQADRQRIEEEREKERERAGFVREARADLQWLPVIELAGMDGGGGRGGGGGAMR